MMETGESESNRVHHAGFYVRFGKRGLDILIASALLLASFPVFIVIALLVRGMLGSPVLFEQRRAGLNGRLFVMRKFRSMTAQRDRKGELLPDHLRLTRFGRVLRASSLDELPELFDVLAGRMSLVGPRPLLPEYLPLYSPRQNRRHEVRPGITGWAQVNGRNALGWQDRFECDVWYVDNVTLLLDVRILFRTILQVLSSRNVEAAQGVTVAPFAGNGGRDES